MPLFTPAVSTESTAAAERLAAFCAWFSAQAGVPETVPLTAQLRRPAPLALGAFGVSRVAWGPVPTVHGWPVWWHESAAGGPLEVGYLVTRSGRTYRLARQGSAAALFSDRAGFPPQPNPVTAAHVDRIEEGLRALLAVRTSRRR